MELEFAFGIYFRLTRRLFVFSSFQTKIQNFAEFDDICTMNDSSLRGVLTGDLIGSRHADPARWIPALKSALGHWGAEPRDWEIYRGDSFTLMVDGHAALLIALVLQATLLAEAKLHVRIGIGIGEVSWRSDRITESQGTAFERSGEAFDALKRSPLKMRTERPEWDGEWEVTLGFASRAIESWTPSSAAAVATALLHPDCSQGEWAQALGKSQSTISEALKRAQFDEIQSMLRRFSTHIARPS